MTTPGETYATLIREVWQQELKTTLFFNHWMFNQSLFPIVPSLGGETISTGYQYSMTTTAGTYNYDDPMNDPFTSAQVRAYWNKDPFQESARVFEVLQDYQTNGGTEVDLDGIKQALTDGTNNLLDVASTTMITDVEGQVDASGNWSDGALSRATYDFASYEESTSTGLTLAHVEDAEEALMTHTTYGNKVRSTDELVWLMPKNQHTNWSRLAAGATAFEYNAVQGQAIDAGRQKMMNTFNGIELVIVPDMTTTVLLLLHKPNVKIHETRQLRIKEKTEQADTLLWHLSCNYNAIAHNPKNHAKLSAKTA